MNILWLSHMVPYPPKGGMLQRSYNLLKEASKYHNIYLLAFNQSNLLKTFYPDIETGLAEAEKVLSDHCKALKILPIPSESSRLARFSLLFKGLLPFKTYTVSWLDSKLFRETLLSWLNKYQFDLTHFDTISFAPYIKYLPHTCNILNHHNIESHMMLRRTSLEKNILKKFYFWQEGIKLKHYETKMCPKFDHHIACSELDIERLKSHVPDISADEVPNGVDLEYFTPDTQAQTENSLIFAGGLSWYPNRDAMLFFANEIWPLLKNEIPGVTMNVVGSHPPDELLALAKTDPNFIVHGFVDDVRPYINQAAVYVCPIRDGGGTKLKILDALSMQKALVADPRACEGIAVIDNENVLLATDPGDYVLKIKSLLEDKNTRLKLGASGRKLIEDKYSYESIGKNLSQIYNEAVTRKRN